MESIPGVARRSTEAILAEIGDDMLRFPTATHLASSARVYPSNHESVGKLKSASPGKGNRWLPDVRRWPRQRPDEGKLYHRMKACGGSKKAIVAVQHAIPVAIWHMLTIGSLHEDLARCHFASDRAPAR